MYFEEDVKLEEVKSKYKFHCKCGHTVAIYPFEHRISKICSWCGNLVFINKKEEFKHKLKKEMKK
jgi:ribosomal protein S27AE